MAYILLAPTSSLISSSIAAKKGIVYKSGDIFENIKKLDAIAFDKTGTLTEGKLSVIKTTIPEEY
jgi:Cu+-exporting ATPase